MATAPPVIVRLPSDLGGLEVLVRHEDWGVECDVRATDGLSSTWTPVSIVGGSFEVRSR